MSNQAGKNGIVSTRLSASSIDWDLLCKISEVKPFSIEINNYEELEIENGEIKEEYFITVEIDTPYGYYTDSEEIRNDLEIVREFFDYPDMEKSISESAIRFSFELEDIKYTFRAWLKTTTKTQKLELINKFADCKMIYKSSYSSSESLVCENK